MMQGPDVNGMKASNSPGKTVPEQKSMPGGTGVSFAGGGESDLSGRGPGGTSPADSSMNTNYGKNGPMECPSDK